MPAPGMARPPQLWAHRTVLRRARCKVVGICGVVCWIAVVGHPGGCLPLARLWLNRRAGRVQSRATNSADPCSIHRHSLLGRLYAINPPDGCNNCHSRCSVGLRRQRQQHRYRIRIRRRTSAADPSCTVACSFADLSSDPDGDNTITTRHWDFGDGTTVDNPGATPSHTYATAGTPTVTLTVTDNGGKSNTKSLPVTVSGGTTNTPPVASFVVPSTCRSTPPVPSLTPAPIPTGPSPPGAGTSATAPRLM